MSPHNPIHPGGSVDTLPCEGSQDERVIQDTISPNLFQRESFDWADDVEQDIASKSSIPTFPSTLQPELFHWASDVEEETASRCIIPISANLSRPESSCCADDVEEEIASTTNASPTPLPPDPFDWAVDVEDNLYHSHDVGIAHSCCGSHSRDNFPRERIQTPPRSHPLTITPRPIPSSHKRCKLISGHGQGRLFDSNTDCLFPFTSKAMPSKGLPLTNLTIIEAPELEESDSSYSPSTTSLNSFTEATSQDWEFVEVDEEVEAMFRYRAMSTQNEGDVHHFNWMCDPIGRRSTTPPEVSLVCIQAGPKVSTGRDVFRVQSIMNRALPFIDPVAVSLEGQHHDILSMRGSSLLRASQGRVFKLYSLHGAWVNDEDVMKDQIMVDTGNNQQYTSPGLAIGNGFLVSSPIKSVSDWSKSVEAAVAGRVFKLPRKQFWKPTSSRLRTIEAVTPVSLPELPPPQLEAECKPTFSSLRTLETASLDPALEATPARLEAKAKPQRHCHLTTARPGAISHEYFSFPTPDFDEPQMGWRLRDAIRSLWEAMGFIFKWPWK
ncbi:hypothetical protein N7467_008570 [Penicillium canescens]|nr:hypothetical protein N7467_008570 [Penicillium canescens]